MTKRELIIAGTSRGFMHQAFGRVRDDGMITRWSSWRPVWQSANVRVFSIACLTGLVFGLLFLVSPLLAAAVVLGSVIVVTSLSKPIILCCLVVSATILTSGMVRGRFFPVFSGNEISMIGAIAIVAVILLAGKTRKVQMPKYYWLALALLAGGTVFVPVATFLVQGVQLNNFKTVSMIQYFLLFWLFAVVPASKRDRRTIILWMLAFGSIVALVGLAQAVGIGPVNQLLAGLYSSSHQEVAATAGRPTSLLGSWNSLGIFMTTMSLICWAVMFEIAQPVKRLLVMGIMGLSVLCLIASGSYAGLIGTVIGLALIQILSGRKVRSVPVLVTGFVGIALSVLLCYPFLQPLIERRLLSQFQSGSLVPQTFEYRLMVWRDIFIPAIQKHFPWPVYPMVPSWYAWGFEESQYILLLFRTGLAGFISYLAWIGITIGWLFRNYRCLPGFDKSIASAALALIIVLVIAGATNEVFSFAGTIDYLWIMLALVANTRMEETQWLKKAA